MLYKDSQAPKQFNMLHHTENKQLEFQRSYKTGKELIQAYRLKHRLFENA